MTDIEIDDSLPEFEPEDEIPDFSAPSKVNQELQLRRLQREAIAMKGGDKEHEKALYNLLGVQMKIQISDERILLGNEILNHIKYFRRLLIYTVYNIHLRVTF